jgi:hypothetical protein
MRSAESAKISRTNDVWNDGITEWDRTILGMTDAEDELVHERGFSIELQIEITSKGNNHIV